MIDNVFLDYYTTEAASCGRFYSPHFTEPAKIYIPTLPRRRIWTLTEPLPPLLFQIDATNPSNYWCVLGKTFRHRK
jgi:hypothetical protein